MKTEYPHLIECPTNAIDQDAFGGEPLPATPDAIDKENVSMTEILPHIFVGMYQKRTKPIKRRKIRGKREQSGRLISMSH